MSEMARLCDGYVHELLSSQEKALVEEKVANDPAWAAELQLAMRRKTLIKQLPPSEPSNLLVPATMTRVEGEQQSFGRLRRRTTWVMAGVLAAGLLVLIGMNVYYATMKATSYDLLVLGQNQLLASTRASLRIRLVDRDMQSEPVAGVPVVVKLTSPQGKSVELASFETDENGTGNPRFEVPDWADGDCTLTVKAKTSKGEEVLTRTVKLTCSWRVMLSTDKPVYKPGQMIQIRALALRRPDLKPIAEHEAVFTVADPKGNIIFKHEQKTSKFGLTWAECELADEILEGSYAIVCRIGDTESKSTVEVKKYVLPRFKVEVRPSRAYYAPGETMKIAIAADYFFGKPVAKGEVEAKVVSSVALEELKQPIKGTLDDKGKATLTWTIPRRLVGREEDEGDARLTFEVKVTDSAEQSYSGSATRMVTTRPVRIEVVPEAGRLVRGLKNNIHLLVTRVDGFPVGGATVEVTDIKDKIVTDARGAASFVYEAVAQPPAWNIKVSDKAGTVLARKNVTLPLGAFHGKDFLLRMDRAVYRAGQTIKLTALGNGKEPIFVDFLRDGQCLLTESVALENGKGEYSFDIPTDLFGTVQVVAYRFTPNGSALRKTRVLFIEPPAGLKIVTTLDKDTYRPGKKAKLTLQITDDKGKPTPGALSVAAVDEAVFSVLSQRPGMEQAFYTLDEELLKPVYAIYPWEPGRSKGTDQRDQALFAVTAQEEFDGGRGEFDGEVKDLRIEPRGRRPGRRGEISAPPGRLHTLQGDTLPDKEREVYRKRDNLFGALVVGWILFIIAVITGGYVLLWLHLPSTTMIGFTMTIGIIVVVTTALGICLFAMPGCGGDEKATKGDKDKKDGGPRRTLEMANAPGGVRGFEKKDGGPEDGAEKDRDNKVAVPPMDAVAPERPRVRRYFPETLLWIPQQVTDAQGRHTFDITLADSITTWRLAASAVSAQGQLGAVQLPLKVFQPFFVDINVPVYLTRGDEVSMPVVVYNYLPRTQKVTLTFSTSGGINLSPQGMAEQVLTLEKGEVRSITFPITADKVGNHKLLVTAIGEGSDKEGKDAIEREIEVVPDGRRVETAINGNLTEPVSKELTIPDDAIEGSVKLLVKIYPSGFSQVLEGLESIFRMPSGCFEQTSSTTYPNILAVEYITRTKAKIDPKTLAKARRYVRMGYQRLLGFEVQGGGFEWFGQNPAHKTLSAYGLMEFEDMAKVSDVDPKVIERTRAWLLEKRKADGSWDADEGLHERMVQREAKEAKLSMTAYIAWAVFRDGKASDKAQKTLDYLLATAPGQIRDPYVLALMCNALLAMDKTGKEAKPYLNRLAGLATLEAGGKFASWKQAEGGRTQFYGGGDSSRIETTALAVLALKTAKREPILIKQALAWIVSMKDPHGTWHSTQATVLSLKALLAGTGKGGDGPRQIELQVGNHTESITIPANRSEVVKQLDRTKFLEKDATTIKLTEKTKTGAGYQLSFRYHVPAPKEADTKEPLAISIDYDKKELSIGQTVKVTAKVTNRMKLAAPMVMLDLPVPPGFDADTSDLDNLVEKGTIARVQARGTQVLVYLRNLKPEESLTLTYRLTAKMTVKATVPAAQIYEYYDPAKKGRSLPAKLVVK